MINMIFAKKFIPENIVEHIEDLGILQKLLKVNSRKPFINNYKLNKVIQEKIYCILSNDFSEATIIKNINKETVALREEMEKQAEKENEEKQNKADEIYEENQKIISQINKLKKKGKKTGENVEQAIQGLQSLIADDTFEYSEVPEVLPQELDLYILAATNEILTKGPIYKEEVQKDQELKKKERREFYEKEKEEREKKKQEEVKKAREEKLHQLKEEIKIKEEYVEKKEAANQMRLKYELLNQYFRIPRCNRCMGTHHRDKCPYKGHETWQIPDKDFKDYAQKVNELEKFVFEKDGKFKFDYNKLTRDQKTLYRCWCKIGSKNGDFVYSQAFPTSFTEETLKSIKQINKAHMKEYLQGKNKQNGNVLCDGKTVEYYEKSMQEDEKNFQGYQGGYKKKSGLGRKKRGRVYNNSGSNGNQGRVEHGSGLERTNRGF